MEVIRFGETIKLRMADKKRVESAKVFQPNKIATSVKLDIKAALTTRACIRAKMIKKTITSMVITVASSLLIPVVGAEIMELRNDMGKTYFFELQNKFFRSFKIDTIDNTIKERGMWFWKIYINYVSKN